MVAHKNSHKLCPIFGGEERTTSPVVEARREKGFVLQCFTVVIWTNPSLQQRNYAALSSVFHTLVVTSSSTTTTSFHCQCLAVAGSRSTTRSGANKNSDNGVIGSCSGVFWHGLLLEGKGNESLTMYSRSAFLQTNKQTNKQKIQMLAFFFFVSNSHPKKCSRYQV